MGRRPDYPKQIEKLNREIDRLKKCVNAEKKYHETEKRKWYTMLEQEKINAYRAGCLDTLKAIEDEETSYMKFMKDAQTKFERLYRDRLKKKKKQSKVS